MSPKLALLLILLFAAKSGVYAQGNAEEQNSAAYNLQNDIKEVVATYLVEMTNYPLDDDIEAAARYADSGPIPYGKHHHNSQDRYAQLLQKLQEQEQQLQQLKQTGTAQQNQQQQQNQGSTGVQQAKQESLTSSPASVPVVAATAASAPVVAATPAPATPVQPLQEAVTSIPIILSTSTAASPVAIPAASAPAATISTTTQLPASTRPTVDPVHHINQVNKILGNVANGNIVGIVDESLAIRAPAPVRNLVTNIMKVIFCNPIDRLFGRCAPNQVDAANNSVKGK